MIALGRFENLTGKRFNSWTIVEELGNGKVLCECQCGTRKALYKKAVKEGKTKSCGCERHKNCLDTKINNNTLKKGSKYIGLTINELTIKGISGEKFVCDCSCGKKDIVIWTSHVIRGTTKSCGHLKQEMEKDWVGKKYGYLEVISKLKDTRKVLCKCICGKETEVFKSALERGQTRSCGCKYAELNKQTMLSKYGEQCTLKIENPREDWQIEAISSKENLESLLKSYNRKLNAQELADILGVNMASVWRNIHKYELEDYIEEMKASSYLEDDIANYIGTITDEKIFRHTRQLDVSGKKLELDIYIPSKSIAIEVDGIYWHSEQFKDKYYHQLKTLACEEMGIRLIHIFENEWINDNESMKKFLYSQLSDNKKIIYARHCNIQSVNSGIANKFISENHIQGKLNSSINIGLYDKDSLIGIMTFGKPRYDINCDFELLRLCFKYDVIVVGGAEKMFKYFLTNYTCDSIVSYCDITKFNGTVYDRLGFKLVNVTEPGYFWVNNKYEVCSRYQAQKHRLLANGFGNLGNTEEEIMKNRGFSKIYTSGNKKFIYRKEL